LLHFFRGTRYTRIQFQIEYACSDILTMLNLSCNTWKWIYMWKLSNYAEGGCQQISKKINNSINYSVINLLTSLYWFSFAISMTRLIWTKYYWTIFFCQHHRISIVCWLLSHCSWYSIYSINWHIGYSVTLQPYVYADSLDGVIILISFGCVFVCNLCMYACYSDILIDYLWCYKVFRVSIVVRVSI